MTFQELLHDPDLWVYLVAAVAAICIIVGIIAFFVRRGAKPSKTAAPVAELGFEATPVDHLPEGVGIGEYAYLVSGGLAPSGIAALLVKLAKDGFMKIEKREKGFIFSKTDIVPPAGSLDEVIYDGIFAGGGEHAALSEMWNFWNDTWQIISDYLFSTVGSGVADHKELLAGSLGFKKYLEGIDRGVTLPADFDEKKCMELFPFSYIGHEGKAVWTDAPDGEAEEQDKTNTGSFNALLDPEKYGGPSWYINGNSGDTSYKFSLNNLLDSLTETVAEKAPGW